MFSPKVTKPQTTRIANSTSSPLTQRSTLDGAVKRAHLLQRSIGDQAKLQLLARRGFSPAGKDPDGAFAQEAAPENVTVRGTRPGVAWDFSKIPVFAPDSASRPQELSPAARSPQPGSIQKKLIVGQVNDPLEHEADRAADRVMSMPDPQLPNVASAPRLSRKCAACEEEEPIQTLATKQAGVSEVAGGKAPAVVHEVLHSPGQPLDPGTRSFMESRFGHDFQHVRVHSDAKAAESATAVNALAYTVGSDVVFGAGQYAPNNAHGRHLLAHELSHVIQQNGAARGPLLQRFAASETSRIAPTPQDMLTQIKQLIDAATTNGQLNWDFLVEISGGSSTGRKINKSLGSNDSTIKSRLLTRYLFTCRCGLIDMRHFMQLLYISNFSTGISQSEARGNRAATSKGREHELTAESASRFGAEDTPSNALGAATNLALPGLPGPDAVFDAIKDTLTRCDPIGWSSLSPASKDQIVHFYGDLIPDPTPKKPGDLIPKNQNQTAIPDILPVNECGSRERSLPFVLDTSDPDRKTLGGKAFDTGSAGLTSDSDIRDFVATQRPELLQLLPAAEKVRLVVRLLQGWVSDDDLDAVEAIYHSATSSEKQQIQTAVKPEDLSGGQRARLRLLLSS